MSIVKKILIIDDHQLFADGLAMILKSSGHNFSVQTSDDPEGLLENTTKLAKYDLILIDLHMPGLSGFVFLSAVRSQSLNLVVAVISGSDKKLEIERTIKLGAQGFIPKNSNSQEFITAAQQLLKGQRYLPMEWDGKIDWRTDNNDEIIYSNILTNRQRQVLELMRDGLQNKQIALVLGIKRTSVNGHVEQLFKKTQVNNRTSCVQVAQARKLI